MADDSKSSLGKFPFSGDEWEDLSMDGVDKGCSALRAEMRSNGDVLPELVDDKTITESDYNVWLHFIVTRRLCLKLLEDKKSAEPAYALWNAATAQAIHATAFFCDLDLDEVQPILEPVFAHLTQIAKVFVWFKDPDSPTEVLCTVVRLEYPLDCEISLSWIKTHISCSQHRRT
jgi:hypothetical protein